MLNIDIAKNKSSMMFLAKLELKLIPYLRCEKFFNPFGYKIFLQYGVYWWSIPGIPFK